MMRRLGNIEKERLMWVGFGVLSVIVIALMQVKSSRGSAKPAESVRRRRSESKPHGVRRHRTTEDPQQPQHHSKKPSNGNNRTGEGNNRGAKRTEKHHLPTTADPATTGGDLNTSNNSKNRRHNPVAGKSAEHNGSSTRRGRSTDAHGGVRDESASALNTSAERTGAVKERSSAREGSSLRPPLSATKRNHSMDRTGSREREGSTSALNQQATNRAAIHGRRAASGAGFQSIHTNVQIMRSDRDRGSEKVSVVPNTTRSRSGGMAASTEALAGTSAGGSLQVRRHSVNGRNSPAMSSAVDTRSEQERLRQTMSKESEGKMRYIQQWMSDEAHSAHVIRREGPNALANATEDIGSDAPVQSTASNTAQSAALGEDELFFTRSMTNSQAADLRLLTRNPQRCDGGAATDGSRGVVPAAAATGLQLRAPPALGGGNARRDADENDSDLPLCPEPPSREGKTDPRVHVTARNNEGHHVLDVEIDLDGISPIQPVRPGTGAAGYYAGGASPNPRNPTSGVQEANGSPHSRRNRQNHDGEVTPEGGTHGQGDLSGDSYSLDLTPTTRVRVSSSRPQPQEAGLAGPSRSSVGAHHHSDGRAEAGPGGIESTSANNERRLQRSSVVERTGAEEAADDRHIESPGEESSRSSTLSAPATQRGAVGVVAVSGTGTSSREGNNGGEVHFTDPVVAGELYALKRLLVFHVNSLNAMPLSAQSWLELHDLLVDLPPQLYALVNVLSNDGAIPALPELRMGDVVLQQLVNDTKTLLSGSLSHAASTRAEKLRSSQGRRYKLSVSRRTVEIDVNRRGNRVPESMTDQATTSNPVVPVERSPAQKATRRFRDLEIDASEEDDHDDNDDVQRYQVINATTQGGDSSMNDSRRRALSANQQVMKLTEPHGAHTGGTPHSSPALSRVGGPEMTSQGSSFAGTPPGTLPSHASGVVGAAAISRDQEFAASGGGAGGARSNLLTSEHHQASPTALNVDHVKGLLSVLATPDAQRIMQQLQAECSSLGVSATPQQESTTASGHSAGRGNYNNNNNNTYQRAQTSVTFASQEPFSSPHQRPSVDRQVGVTSASVPREHTRESSYGTPAAAASSSSARFQRSQTAVASSSASPGNNAGKRPAQTSRYLFSKQARDSDLKMGSQRGNTNHSPNSYNNNNDAGRGNLSHGSMDSSGRNHESGSFSSGGGRSNGVSNTTPGNTYNGKGRGSVFTRLYPGKSGSSSTTAHVEDAPSPYYSKQQQQPQHGSSPQQQQQQPFIKIKPPMMF